MLKLQKSLIGMIHLPAMPGCPNNTLKPDQIIEQALTEAKIYSNCGMEILMIENMHDVPYMKNVSGDEVTSLMAIIGYEIKRQTGLPVGIQILAGANKQALAAAYSANLDFIRAEGFVFGHVADEGYIESCAGELLRYRKQIGAENIAVFTDIKKKHSSHSITNDTSVAETAKAAQFFLSDGIILTGSATGKEPILDEVKQVKEAVSIPIILGSGISVNNVELFFPFADGFIVGSAFKNEEKWFNPLNELSISKFIQKFNSLKNA
ncbi:MAG: BtpA/SgcQ family protein [Salinivirgaceae bacterium]